MSTKIGKIKGRYEGRSILDILEVKYEESDISITRFYGGKENGRMLQLTVQPFHSCIQLTEGQIKELIKMLQDSFNDEIYPSE